MPGYLVKAANFVAEIGNDEELMQLAEVDTIKKDTLIRVLPGKDWTPANKIPILRKVWKLDSDGIAPRPIKKVSEGIGLPGSPKLPPRIETVIDSRIEIEARAATQAMHATLETEKDAGLYEKTEAYSNDSDANNDSIREKSESYEETESGEDSNSLDVTVESTPKAMLSRHEAGMADDDEVQTAVRSAKVLDFVEGGSDDEEAVTGVRSNHAILSDSLAFEMQATQPLKMPKIIGHLPVQSPDTFCDVPVQVFSCATSDQVVSDVSGGSGASYEEAQADSPSIFELSSDAVIRLDEGIPSESSALHDDEDRSQTKRDMILFEAKAASSSNEGGQDEEEGAKALEACELSEAHDEDACIEARGDEANRDSVLSEKAEEPSSMPRAQESSALSEMVDEGENADLGLQTKTESLLLQMRNMADDEYIEASPSEVTYVMESNLVRDRDLNLKENSISNDGNLRECSKNAQNADCPSIEICLGESETRMPDDFRGEGHAFSGSIDSASAESEKGVKTSPATEHKAVESVLTSLQNVQCIQSVSLDLSESVLESGVVDSFDEAGDAPRAILNEISPSCEAVGLGGESGEKTSACHASDSQMARCEIEAARAAIEAAKRYAACGGRDVDGAILSHASQLVEALEKARHSMEAEKDAMRQRSRIKSRRRSVDDPQRNARERQQSKLNFDAQEPHRTPSARENDSPAVSSLPQQDSGAYIWEGETDDSPSEQFKIRRRSDLLPEILSGSQKHEAHSVEKNKNASEEALDLYASVEEHSDVLKIQNSSELRHMLRAEALAAASGSGLKGKPSEDLSTKDGLRTLFEKEDELHLFLANEIREKESQFKRNADADGHLEEEQDDERKLGSLQAMTSERPVANERAVVRPIPKAEKTNVAAHPIGHWFASDGKIEDLSFDDDFFTEKLLQDELPVAKFSSLYLTTHRIWNIDGSKKCVKSYEVYDIENVRGTALHEGKNLALLIVDIALVVIVALYYLFFMRDSGGGVFVSILLAYGVIMLPICYYLSFYTTLQISVGTTVLKSKCHITKENRSEALSFLNRVEAVRVERRNSIRRDK